MPKSVYTPFGSADVHQDAPLLQQRLGCDGRVASPARPSQSGGLPAPGVLKSFLVGSLVPEEVCHLNAERSTIVLIGVTERVEQAAPVARHRDHHQGLSLAKASF